MPNFTDAVSRDPFIKMGEVPSLNDFGADPTGAVDSSAAISKAIASVISAGGYSLHATPGTYRIDNPILIDDTVADLTIYGDQDATIFKRGAALPSGKGLFDISGKRITLRTFQIDGNITTPVGVDYATITSPVQDSLSRNTSIWIQGGAQDVTIDGLTIQHTGGYSILADATAADVLNVNVQNCRFVNNRPHLFGPTGDLTYGAWTGGVLGYGVCTSGAPNVIDGLHVDNCTWDRVAGNCAWTNSGGFYSRHRNVTFTNNKIKYCGLDGVQHGNVQGGLSSGNVIEYSGYVTTTDIDTPTRKKYTDPCAIDSSGYVSGVNYTNNTISHHYGQAINADGFQDGAISHNAIINDSTDTSTSKGIETGDSYAQGGGLNVTIVGNTIVNCYNGGIVLCQGNGCLVAHNNIVHPASAALSPIYLYAVPKVQTWQPDPICDKNTITSNDISGAYADWAIQEVVGAASSFSNTVTNNRIKGSSKGEFSRSANTASNCAFVLSSNTPSLSYASSLSWERTADGIDEVSTLSYTAGAGGTKTRILTYYDSQATLRVSHGDGNAGLSLGARVTPSVSGGISVSDFFYGGNAFIDGMLVLSNSNFQSTLANAIDVNSGLVTYSGGSFQASYSLNIGGTARVWGYLFAGNTSKGQIPVTSDTAFGILVDSAIAQTHYAAVVGPPAVAAYDSVDVTGLVTSTLGFFTSAASPYAAFQAPNGAVAALSLYGTLQVYTDGGFYAKALSSAPGSPISGYGGIGYKTGSTYWIWSGSAFVAKDLGSVITGASGLGTVNTVPLFTTTTALGSSNITQDGTTGAITANAVKLTVSGSSAALALEVTAGYVSAASGYYTASSATNAVGAPSGGVTALYLIGTGNVTITDGGSTSSNWGVITATSGTVVVTCTTGLSCTTGFYTVSSSGNAIQAPNGGVLAHYATATGNFTITDGGSTSSNWGVITASSGTVVVTCTSGLSCTTGFYTVSSAANSVQSPNGGVLAKYLAATNNLTVTDGGSTSSNWGVFTASSGTVVLTSTGGLSATTGFYTVSSATNSIQSPNGGVTAKWLIATANVTITDGGATPGNWGVFTASGGAVSLAATGGLIVSAFKLTTGAAASKWMTSDASGNASWATLPANVSSLNSLTGAISITAGTGVTVTPSSPNVQISIGQAVGTAATPTFAGMTITGADNTAGVALSHGYFQSPQGLLATGGLIQGPAYVFYSSSELARLQWDDTNKYMTWTPSGGSAYPIYRLAAGTGVSLTPSGNQLTVTCTLSSGVTGSGTANYVPKWSSSSAITDSAAYFSSDNLICPNISATTALQIYGNSTQYALMELSGTKLQLKEGSSGAFVNVYPGQDLSSTASPTHATLTLNGTLPQLVVSPASGNARIDVTGASNSQVTFAGVSYGVGVIGAVVGGISLYSVSDTSKRLTMDGSANLTTITTGLTVSGAVTAPSIKLTTGAAAGYFLSSASDGTASWVSPPSAGVTGTGTANYMAKWSSGTAVGNSSVTDDGTTVTVTTKLVVTGAGATASLTISNGYISSAGGFYTASSAATAIQAPNGSVLASGVTATSALQVYTDASNYALMQLSGTKLQLKEGSGGSFVNVYPGQNLASTAGPTFASMSLSGSGATTLNLASGGVTAQSFTVGSYLGRTESGGTAFLTTATSITPYIYKVRTTLGSLEYSIDGGSTWNAVGTGGTDVMNGLALNQSSTTLIFRGGLNTSA